MDSQRQVEVKYHLDILLARIVNANVEYELGSIEYAEEFGEDITALPMEICQIKNVLDFQKYIDSPNQYVTKSLDDITELEYAEYCIAGYLVHNNMFQNEQVKLLTEKCLDKMVARLNHSGTHAMSPQGVCKHVVPVFVDDIVMGMANI